MTWLIPIQDLSTEQLAAVEADAGRHRLIIGAPGSGKTQILLHRAAYLRDTLGVEPGRFRIFVYTNVLMSYIASALDILDLPLDSVSTFDRWCADYHRAAIGRAAPRGVKGPDFEATRAAVRDHVVKHVHAPIFEFVLVDEGQDLDDDCYQILRRIARHLTVAADHRQQIYDRGSNEEALRGLLGDKRASTTLLEAFRCSPYILDLAASLVEGSEQAEQLRLQARTDPVGRETPLVSVCADFESEKTQLADIVRARALKGDRVAILLPQQRQVYGFAKGLQEAGLEVEIPVRRGKSDKEIEDIDFNSDRPKLLTYHSAKGLTFDTVCLPRLVSRSFSQSDDRVKKLLFVGVTRATQWVYLSGVSGSLISPLVALLDLEDAGKITVRRSSAGLFGSLEPDTSPTIQPIDDFDDLI